MQSPKSQYYLNQCIQAAEKSTMSFTLGAILVKGGKVIAHGYNHQRTNYDGSCKQPGRKPISSECTQSQWQLAWLPTSSRSFNRALSNSKTKNQKSANNKNEMNDNNNWMPNLSSELSTCARTVLRDSRANGGDIYVVRVRSSRSSTPAGSDTNATPVGSALPCTRCLIWCRWAGIRRVFYWASASDTDADGAGGFTSIKPAQILCCVGTAGYVTQADRKISEGTFEFS
ncbi:hypothetical protein FRC10_008792 [Ceratobasidium sp. 414]|nr:hypothetical protein FRC10_008792 [Ceratobasidium sp. 414]